MTQAAKIRAVAFDLDGTLLDTGSVVPDAYIAVVRELGGPALTRREVISAYHVGSTDAVIAELLGRTCAVLLERTGLRRFFRVVLGGDEVKRPKPDPEGLCTVAARLGLTTDKLAYVGDAPRDADAADACGALAIIASWGHEYVPSADGTIVVALPNELVGVFD